MTANVHVMSIMTNKLQVNKIVL